MLRRISHLWQAKPGLWFRRVKYVNGHLVCYGRGVDCIELSFARASRLSRFHDAELATTSHTVNGILQGITAGNEDSSRCAKFIVTEYGPMLAWTQCGAVDDARSAAADGVALEENPDGFCRAVGISPNAQKPKAGHWELEPDGWSYCRSKGKGQYKARLVAPGTPSDIFDAQLASGTAQINAILEACEGLARDPELELCLLVTPPGLFLAWVKEDDSGRPSPLGTVTAESDRGAIYEALGLAGLAGGIPWKPIIAVGSAVVGLGVVLTVVAVSVFSGGSSPPPVVTSTPTSTLSPTATRGPVETRPATGAGAPTPTTVPTEPPRPTAVSTATPIATPTPTPDPGLVSIVESCAFSPASLTRPLGAPVRFRNQTAVSVSIFINAPSGPDPTLALSPGQQSNPYTLGVSGTYFLECSGGGGSGMQIVVP